MTRARDRLYIGGWLPKGRAQAPADSWYAMLSETFDSAAQQPCRGEQPLQKADDETDALPVNLPDAPHWMRAPPREKPDGYGFSAINILAIGLDRSRRWRGRTRLGR